MTETVATSHKLTVREMEVLRLVEWTPRNADGWSKCAPKIFQALVKAMPEVLVERSVEGDNIMVRLTQEAMTVLRWT